MEKRMMNEAFAVFLLLLIGFSDLALAQTQGTLTFGINPVSHNSSYGTKHVIAIWLENDGGTFIKTKLRQSSSKTVDHLGTWTSKSSSSVVDAVTGPTLTTYVPIQVIWDGTNVSGAVVPDGNYKVWIEMAWGDSKTTDKTVTSYSFTKNDQPSALTPANTNLFTDVTINWVPSSTTSIKNINPSNDLTVYPNPSVGLVNINLKSIPDGSKLQVINSAGITVLEEKITKKSGVVKTIDLSKYANGVYVVNIISGTQNVKTQYKVVLER